MTNPTSSGAARGFDAAALRARYRAEREKRLRPDGADQYVELKGDFAGLAAGRTDTWQGPAIDVTSLVQAGWVYDASAFVSVQGAASDAVRLSAKITCQGQSATFTSVAATTASQGSYAGLSGTLSIPLCPLSEVVLYAEGPAAGVSILIDDVALRGRS